MGTFRPQTHDRTGSRPWLRNAGTRTAGRWRTKSVEQSIEDTDEPGTELRKDLTWWDLTVFGVSVVIGAGIFTITASTAGNITGPAISISFLIAAVACGLAALCYAEFASTLPVAGSAYTFSYATFGEVVAWIIGWDLVLEFAVGAATVAKGWSSYLGRNRRLRISQRTVEFQIDRERQNNITLLGWQVLRFTRLDLTEYPQRVLAVIRSATSA